MDQHLAFKSLEEESGSFETLVEDVIPPIVKEIRSWAEEEEIGREPRDWSERRDQRRS